MERRDFLKAVGATGYSLLVFTGDAAPAAAADITPEERRRSFDRLVAPAGERGTAPHEPHMALVDLECDLLVAGGGLAGVLASLAAARGAKVILVQDRSRLGGNSSSEVKMHVVGANNHTGRPGWHKGGILEELRLDNAVNNPHRSWEMWDLLLYDKIVSEPNCTLLLETVLYAVEMEHGRIRRALARCDKTEHVYRISAPLYADCTGDSRLALEAGATMRWGHEARSDFNEPLAPSEPSRETLGSSILFTARNYGRPVPYKAPRWARPIEQRHLRFRPITTWEYGYWWIEWGGRHDIIRDNERIRFELIAIVTGVWDYIKNSGRFPTAANWGMDWVGMLPGKRESRRIEGDHILTQQDLMGLNADFPDAVAIGGWGLDEHPPGGFDDTDRPAFVTTRLPEVYNIPLRALFSKDVPNLFMAGRNASCSHVAFTSTRVMATCAVMGQAVGTAAALCKAQGLTPRELSRDNRRRSELQQTLLRDDQTIKNARNLDPLDLARSARATAAAVHQNARPENVLDGFVRDAVPGEFRHRWAAPLAADGTWIELTWPAPQRLRRVQITFDSGFHRELTLTSSDSHNAHIVRAPQPETVRDYTVQVLTEDGRRVEVARVMGNYQRLRRHEFEPVSATAVRVTVTTTNGSEQARIYEIRCYA